MQGVVCEQVAIEFPTAAGPLRVLKGVDFLAPAGQLTMLVGPSGCGKTTLISIIAGLLRGATGSVSVFGKQVTSLSGAELVPFRLANIGFIFQQYNLLAGLSAAVITSASCRASSRAGSSSAWRSRGRWSMSRGCCFAMSPPRPSTASPARPSWACCATLRCIRSEPRSS